MATNLEACIRMVEGGRMDFTLQSTAASVQTINQAGLGEQVTVLPHVFGGMDFTLLLSKSSALGDKFLQSFDQVIQDMHSDGIYAELITELREKVRSTD